MQFSRLKNTQLIVSRIGMGCSRFASASRPRSEREVQDAVHCALDCGINFFDTADSYGQGDSEIRLGRALKGRREKAIVSTKVGYCFPQASKLIRKLKPMISSTVKFFPAAGTIIEKMRSYTIHQDFSPDYVRTSLDASLKRLRTDYVDLFWLHDPDPGLVHHDELVAVLDDLVGAGKIRYYGFSCRQASDALAMVAARRKAVLQIPFSVAEFDDYDRILPMLEKARAGVVARGILARGLMVNPSTELKTIVDRSGLAPWHAALRYALSQPCVDTALVGMSKTAHVERMCAVFEYPNLSTEICTSLDMWRVLHHPVGEEVV